MPAAVTENHLETAALEWFAALDYEVLDPTHLDPDAPGAERSSTASVILEGRLRAALHRLNPDLPVDAVEDALRRVQRADAPTLVQNNLAFHRMLTDGVPVEIATDAGGVRGLQVRLFDFDHPAENDWLVVRQLAVVDRATGTGQPRRADLVVYVNGLPLAVLELKNPTSPNATIWDAFNQLQTYVKDVPSLFVTNALLVISDDVEARLGALTTPQSRFAPWRTISGEGEEPASAQPLKVLIAGVFDHARFLDLIRSFVTFEHDRGRIIKKLAGYHQFHAVRAAVEHTVRASRPNGDRRIGVVWHTQGSGKSLTMVFYAGKLVLRPEMENPTLVVLTDRNDLDDQLFGTFSQSQALLRQKPVQARDRAHLRELLKTAAGGVYFTTIQKFLPPEGEKSESLSDRRNIVVIADEAHRSQYESRPRFDTQRGEHVYGFAKHMRNALPHASFIGFTGTPLELEDKNTRKVFGDYISIYDIARAVQDKATVPIYYENRLARLDLDESERPQIDPKFEEVTEGEEEDRRESLKSQWSTIEALVGTEKRVALVAADIVRHFEKRLETLAGKGLIVCMSRRICVDVYEAIRKLRPEWHDDEDDGGRIKVVMTGSASDDAKLQPHVRSPSRRERIAERFKDPNDPLQLVIVRDMWLTGFDVPSLHTLYVDKPMRGHNLMQAIARVNRVFGDKPGGRVVDYIGIAGFLREAMLTYSQSGGKGDPTSQQDAAVAVMLEKLEVCRDTFHGFDYARFFTGTPGERLAMLPAAREHILSKRKPKAAAAPGAGGKDKKAPREIDEYDVFVSAAGDLSKAFALASPHEKCEEIRDEVAFFQAVKVGLDKLASGRRGPAGDIGHAVRQIVANAVVTSDVIDVFEAAGLQKPDISILSPEFLAELHGMKHKNLAAEVLKRLLEDEVRTRSRRSVVQAKKFSQMLEQAVSRYTSRAIESAQVIEELLDIAKQMREADSRGESLGLGRDERAFYEALAENESAVKEMTDTQLAAIAVSLTQKVRDNATIDWQHKSSVQAKLRALLKRVLKEHGYPPDAAEAAVKLVLEQAKVLGINVVEGGSAEEPPDGGDVEAASTAPRQLPYPIAVFDAILQSQDTAALRVKTRMDAIERALAFLVATELAVLQERNGGTYPAEALAVLGNDLGKPVSMGTWLEYAWKLARLLPVDATEPAARAARTLVTPEGKQSELALELARDVLPYRNTFAHGVTDSDEAVAAREAPLHAIWQRVKQALAPLGEYLLVTRAQLLDFAPGETYRYRLRIHQGPSERFPVEEHSLRAQLADGWGYLIRPGGEPPLALVPIVFAAHSEESNRREVFMARALVVERGARVDGMGVASSTKMKWAVPP